MEKDELATWMASAFRNQLDKANYDLIYETLNANYFTTRLKLKLIQDDAIDMMFSRVLPLGAKAVLTYQLQQLRQESPLPSLKSKRTQSPTSIQSSSSSAEEPKKKVVRALQEEENKLKIEVSRAKEEIKEIKMNIESMNVNITEPPPVGNGKNVCGHCHHRGHRNSATRPCSLKKCSDFTFCGMKDKHPEYFAKLNSFKIELRKREKAVSALEGQMTSVQQFSSSSEFQFIKNLTPRMYQVDQSYKTNKAKLMRDVRLLRDGLDGKIPPVTTNDSEQLRLLIARLRKENNIKADDPVLQEVAETSTDVSPIKAESAHHLKQQNKKKNLAANPHVSASSDDDDSFQSSNEDESPHSVRKHERKHKKTNLKSKCTSKHGKRKRHSKRSRSQRYDSSDEDDNAPVFHPAFNSYLQHAMPYMNPFQFYNPNAMLPGAFIQSPYNHQSMLVPPVTNVNNCTNTTSMSVTTPTKFPDMQVESNNTDQVGRSPTSSEAAKALLDLCAGKTQV